MIVWHEMHAEEEDNNGKHYENTQRAVSDLYQYHEVGSRSKKLVNLISLFWSPCTSSSLKEERFPYSCTGIVKFMQIQ